MCVAYRISIFQVDMDPINIGRQNWLRQDLAMTTSSDGTFYTLLALCEENPPVTGGFPSFRCFLWYAPEQTAEQTIDTQVIWDAITLIMTWL